MTHSWRIYTDMDGTLLDHHDYNWNAAKPLLKKCQAEDIPVIPNTSKTAAELLHWFPRLGLPTFAVVENGGMVLLPHTHEWWRTHRSDWSEGDVAGKLLGRPYEDLCAWLDAVRLKEGFQCRGFHDADVATVVAWTGLTTEEAQQAKQRQCSEPIFWEDDAEALKRLMRAAQAEGLQLQQGGRFLHLSDNTNKATGMAWLETILPGQGVTIALGDGGNDIPMLEAADFAVAVRNAQGTHVAIQQPQTYFTKQAGPAGWAEGLVYWLNLEE